MSTPNRGLDKANIYIEPEPLEFQLEDEQDLSSDFLGSQRQTEKQTNVQTDLKLGEEKPDLDRVPENALGELEKPKRLAKDRITRLRNTDLITESERSVVVGSPKLEYGNNYIKTNKYSFVTFIPLNLLEQFSKPANIYFLFIAMLQCIPDASITNALPIILVPLSFIVLLTAIKDLAEDLKKYTSDKEENHTVTQIVRQKQVHAIFWQDIYSGDVIEIRKGQYIPADCLLLYSSNTEQNQCFVETKNLDGETNLKKKHMVPASRSFESIMDCLDYFRGCDVHFEKENPNLQVFEGRLMTPDGMIRLTLDNLLLRGTSLQNTDYVYCVALSTG